MTSTAAQPTNRPRSTIASVVLSTERHEPRARLLIPTLVALAVHGLLGVCGSRWASPTQLASSSTPAKTRSPAAREMDVDLIESPPSWGEAPTESEPAKHLRRTPHARHSLSTRAAQAGPAGAGSIVARGPDDPIDLTGDAVVTGTATSYPGGVTSAQGPGLVPGIARASSRPAAAGPPASALDRSSAVSLRESDWSCPWPDQAVEAIDEQTVTIRVVVSAQGNAESVALLSSPGYGFAEAAVACAQRARFVPARDREGKPMRAQSPPIRVRFTR